MRTVKLCLIVSLLSYLTLALTGCDTRQLQRLEEENKAVAMKVDALSRSTSLDLQEKCARAAREEFDSEKWATGAWFTDHYNATLNKCFLRVEFLEERKASQPGGPGMFIHYSVSDAFEKVSYGQLIQKLSEPKPGICEVTLPSEKKECSSRSEFDLLVKQFMER